MREISPLASVGDNYAYGCDMCGKMDGRATLVWREKDLTGGDRSHFSICLECISELYFKHVAPIEKTGEVVIVKRGVITEKIRNFVYKRDGYKCQYCESKENLQIDHIIPFSKGGNTEVENFQTLCKKCNFEKGIT